MEQVQEIILVLPGIWLEFLVITLLMGGKKMAKGYIRTTFRIIGHAARPIRNVTRRTVPIRP